MSTSHACPVAGCSARNLPHDRLMCWKHWQMVPARLRSLIWAHWNNGEPLSNYLQTRTEAIATVNNMVARR